MKTKTKRERIPQTEVLAWLQQNHPRLHKAAEIERDWVWIAADLRGDNNKPTRESIKEYGFIFSRKGGHPLPSGKMGTWAHACEKPIRFKRNGSKPRQSQADDTGNEQPEPDTQPEEVDVEAMRFAGLIE